MNRLRCIITDDEPFAAKGLKGYVEKIDFLELVAVCENALELNQALKGQEVDLLFLDIQMPHITGVEWLKTMKPPLPMVVFTTAHPHYAIEGYELDILDYLLKPIPFARFLKAANKANELFLFRHQTQTPRDYFFVKTDQRLEKVKFDDILLVEALQNYVIIHTTTEKLIAHLTLKTLKDNLPEKNFIQPHRSFLVALDKIKAIEGNQIMLPPNHLVPISKQQREDVLRQIVNFQLMKG